MLTKLYRSPKPDQTNITIYPIALGPIGKTGDAIASQPNLNDDLSSYIRVIHQLLEDGKLQPNEVKVVKNGGFEGVADAYALQQKSPGGGKVVITLQEE